MNVPAFLSLGFIACAVGAGMATHQKSYGWAVFLGLMAFRWLAALEHVHAAKL